MGLGSAIKLAAVACPLARPPHYIRRGRTGVAGGVGTYFLAGAIHRVHAALRPMRQRRVLKAVGNLRQIV